MAIVQILSPCLSSADTLQDASRPPKSYNVSQHHHFLLEEKLHQGKLELGLRNRERDRDQQTPDPEFLQDAFVLQQGAELNSASAFFLG
jgi:hypothetical protein